MPVLLAATFLLAIWWIASAITGDAALASYVSVAAVLGGYMALNIGANDVANNVAAAVGSKALTLAGAVVIAVVFETAGALLAGGDVVSTIRKGIVDPGAIADTLSFIRAMCAALLAAALWLNLATFCGAPVSTTHAIVGGVVGAGIVAGGVGAVNWGVMSKIAASWVISPVLGGIIAAGFLMLLNKTVLSKPDVLSASRRWVPILVAVLAAAFTVYMAMKGLKKIWKPDAMTIMASGAVAFGLTVLIVRPLVVRASAKLENRRKSVNTLFNIPLVCAAALLSFAHGANDVANAVGPLAAIVAAAASGTIDSKVGIPVWIMLVGAIGIAIGLALFGAKLIRTVGNKLTSLDQARAFCCVLSAAITVIAASALALPVSSTHIAIGAVFGVGFYREFRNNVAAKARDRARRAGALRAPDVQPVRPGLMYLERAPLIRRRKLVRRNHFLTIIAAWFITVPSAGALAGLLFYLSKTFLPG